MDLGKLTCDQRDCVTHVDGPLLVSAGAGSGKTFMLTQRVAYALLNPDKSGVEDIDQILAITFTDLAASEIKARVRNRLREEGLAEQALKVDASWISTIHGMCSRILHENALELGLDPQFGLLDETDRDQLLDDCLNASLAEAHTQGAHDELFREYEKADGASSVGTMVKQLVNTASNLREGLDSLAYAEPPSPHDIAVDLYDAMVTCDAVAREGIGMNGKSKSKFTDHARDALECASGMPAFERLAAKADCSYEDVAEAMCRADLFFGNRSARKDPYKRAYAIFRQQCKRALEDCLLGLALPARAELLDLTQRVWDHFEAAKAQQGMLDQNDLLTKTLDAFEHHSSVAARYRDRFKLVMVDEFQDTSSLQIAIISHLTDHDRRLCTVGDTQQSIYRFRGADVDTYRAHKRSMRALEPEGGLYRELGKNFRSHGDIIAFVNRIFGSPQVFGNSGEFIELGWDADHDKANPFPDVPRIDVVAVTNAHQSGVRGNMRHLVEAEVIARRFEALHAEATNQRWGDMVILLGKMTNAEIYARTLRSHGIPCIVTGGSGFSVTPEAQEVGALLNAVADPWDNANLQRALSGGAFGLGADDLYRLGHAADGQLRDLWSGLLAAHADSASARLRLAGTLLTRAVTQSGGRPAGQTLLELAVSSGWLERLQGQGPQGMASAANVLKAIRLVESIENDPAAPRGIPATAARFTFKLDQGIKEKPGALMAEEQDAVRILTIHASKGLEFPIVALADFYGTMSDHTPLRLATQGERTYLSLLPSAATADGTPLGELKKKPQIADSLKQVLIDEGLLDDLARISPDEAQGARKLNQAIKDYSAREELEELRRKFYVGATRPREALIIAVNMSTSNAEYEGILKDIQSGLWPSGGDFANSPEGLDFGGRRRAATARLRLEVDEAGTLRIDGEPAADFLHPAMVAQLDMDVEQDSAAPQATSVPEPPRPGEFLSDLMPVQRPCDPLRAGTFSYSRLAAAARTQLEEASDPDELPPTEAVRQTAGTEPADGTPSYAKAFNVGAVAFGSALHQACQFMVEDLATRRDRGETGARLELPLPERLSTYLRTWGADDSRLPELEAALRRWANSHVAAEAAGYPDLTPEAPFYAMLQGPQGEPIHLEGSIDLLCHNHRTPPCDQTALVVDYKTGGSFAETPEQLDAKHRLQAMCYAYAVLSSGYKAVNLRFVRVQQRDWNDSGQPQTVAYRYETTELQALEESIRAAYAKTRAQ